MATCRKASGSESFGPGKSRSMAQLLLFVGHRCWLLGVKNAWKKKRAADGDSEWFLGGSQKGLELGKPLAKQRKQGTNPRTWKNLRKGLVSWGFLKKDALEKAGGWFPGALIGNHPISPPKHRKGVLHRGAEKGRNELCVQRCPIDVLRSHDTNCCTFCMQPSNGSGSKKSTQTGPLANGNNDEHLRNRSSLLLSHAQRSA